MHNQSPTKNSRLRSPARIAEIFERGSRGSSRLVAARALPNPRGEDAVAVAAGKKLGGAVQRNRMKRRLRAAYRLHKEHVPQGLDLVLIAKRGVLEASWRELTENVVKAAKQAGTAASGPRPPAPTK